MPQGANRSALGKQPTWAPVLGHALDRPADANLVQPTAVLEQ
jgi:hypothetical protein